MAITKTIKGSVWVSGNQLVQNQTLVTPNGMGENTVVLINDIWEDLLSSESTAKRERNYWYWEVQQTNLEDEEVTVRFECPKPKDGLLDQYGLDPNNAVSDWAKYWVGKYKEVSDRYADSCTIQPKSVVFQSADLVDYDDGHMYTVDELTVPRNNLGDIKSLITKF